MRLLNTIRKLRFEKDETSQQALAQALGVTRQTIYFIEKGKVMPSILLAFKIAEYFGKAVDEVFYFNTDINKK
ncbi:MAG: helix-turn-helix transcriptional regulator [Bacteroidetes bacterium]|jgi:putative transcriptional regulator|nr:helix-turn-helix transcriptional regulator [Bacteroidota bacterium]MBT3748001.1 helix-turn-helix transcriptional regulator [Bacteroidota bacterium]MBT4400623.1 helix-turn-helix transcriptional regulator [Bacteroidota bacterium]MBT4408375.1 helix-turn-helix transcriptional regulator [Bacteroidota bacterium]MBT5425072.1 helix-turn-helix transcriptional regulator [Bacteroidota bacterium]